MALCTTYNCRCVVFYLNFFPIKMTNRYHCLLWSAWNPSGDAKSLRHVYSKFERLVFSEIIMLKRLTYRHYLNFTAKFCNFELHFCLFIYYYFEMNSTIWTFLARTIIAEKIFIWQAYGLGWRRNSDSFKSTDE